ncbi:2Fe-2S iron-sulfur cluster-binding protein [Rubrivirga sp. S365]|uniref:2Fe-2S iron-sulfur cluster-binding protein n=1 Tax=Rubrivirga litoralis TaxID=3075598 RepID=A0ABU3BTP2_9BACT|nr:MULTISPECIES: 2Fe-2S iron-sulfur cluster-binding protein [unclassified Rubrivirga]MDT0632650.1 2Fe-2S iron-sulfur cluster-binding protein [Rubrivirga sp. F394]MDT7857173.1 2Fe-2S iron-sulfur cluster-binding protein [Rubrivirga sp. S365]
MPAPSDSPLVDVAITINGESRDLSVDPRASLLDTLRLGLDLNGSKKGCNQGACGACTVLLDGERVNACLVLAVTCDGQEVTTVEGIGMPGHLHPLQDAFIEHDGFQCGYCTPGQIVSGVALLAEAATGQPSVVDVDLSPDSAAHLSDEELSERMSGNICRCGAYPGIRAALRHAAQTTPPASA